MSSATRLSIPGEEVEKKTIFSLNSSPGAWKIGFRSATRNQERLGAQSAEPALFDGIPFFQVVVMKKGQFSCAIRGIHDIHTAIVSAFDCTVVHQIN